MFIIIFIIISITGTIKFIVFLKIFKFIVIDNFLPNSLNFILFIISLK